MHLIEAGKIEWVWNIATTQARKVELRVLALSVHDYQRGLVRCLTWEEVICTLYGMERPSISSSRWDWIWNCSPTHLYALVREGAIDPVDSHWRTGAGGGAKITWQSAVAFARRCRVT